MGEPLCDECGKPQNGEPIYSLGTRRDPKTDEVVSIRHWRCHTPIDQALSDLRDSVRDLERKLR